MALSGTKHDEASFGQYGSSYLTGDGAKLDLKTSGASEKFICAITMLEDLTFQTLSNKNGLNLDNACISTVDGEDEIATPWGGAVTVETSNYAVIVTTSHVFPKGVTIFGNWDKVELNSGSCILYLAPTGRHAES